MPRGSSSHSLCWLYCYPIEQSWRCRLPRQAFVLHVLWEYQTMYMVLDVVLHGGCVRSQEHYLITQLGRCHQNRPDSVPQGILNYLEACHHISDQLRVMAAGVV